MPERNRPTSRVEINMEEVEERKQRLLTEYGEVDVETKYEVVEETEFEEWKQSSLDGYIGGAYVWVTRGWESLPEPSPSTPDSRDERVLMIKGRGNPRWGLPGGGIEDGETAEAASKREVKEEVGIDCDITDLFFIRHEITVSSGEDPNRLHSLAIFFDGKYVDKEISVEASEVDGASWFVRPPARMLPANERRVHDW